MRIKAAPLRAPRVGTSAGLRPWRGPGRRAPTLHAYSPVISLAH